MDVINKRLIRISLLLSSSILSSSFHICPYFPIVSSLSFPSLHFPLLSPVAMLVLNLIKLCQWPGVPTFARGLNAATSPRKGFAIWGVIVLFAPCNVSMERPFKDNTPQLQHQGSVVLDGGGIHANTHLAAGAFGVSVGAFFFFHPCRSPPPALIKRALCERGCEEGRRSSQGSDWRPEVDGGCVCVCVFLRAF